MLNKLLTLLAFVPGAAVAGKIIPQSEAERLQYIKTAEVWFPSDIASKNIFAGPDDKFEWGQTVQCRFMEPDPEDPPGGRSPKFYCLDDRDKDHKVKYGVDNAEVYAEAAAGRLLWALGFGSDRYYPVRIECEGCPKDPWTYIKDTMAGKKDGILGINRNKDKYTKADRIFIPALIEKKYKGEKIRLFKKQGWGWHELMDFEGVPREKQIQREALIALVGGFLQHADNKAQQQRLHCLDDMDYDDENGFEKCKQSIMIVHDLGWTFGHGWRAFQPFNVSSMHLAEWENTPVFEDKNCLVNPHSTLTLGGLVPYEQRATFKPYYISEEGRQFLANILNQLTRTQIEDIFRMARVDFRENVLRRNRDSEAVIKAWADTFEKKVAEINRARCGESPRLK